MRTIRIRAIFGAGVLRPVDPVDLPENTMVTLTLTESDDLPPAALAQAAMQGGALDYLDDPREDMYTMDDGEPV